jgi:hypothetical protein
VQAGREEPEISQGGRKSGGENGADYSEDEGCTPGFRAKGYPCTKTNGSCSSQGAGEHPPGIYKDDKSNPTNLPLNKCSQIPPGPATSPAVHQAKLREHIKTAVEHNKSPSKTEWQRQMDQENAHNPAIDKIMEMTGLEDVKAQVLGIKGKFETSIGQDTDLRKERL